MQKLKRLMREEGMQTLDQIINILIEKAQRILKSMFEADRRVKLTPIQTEHEKLQRTQSR